MATICANCLTLSLPCIPSHKYPTSQMIHMWQFIVWGPFCHFFKAFYRYSLTKSSSLSFSANRGFCVTLSHSLPVPFTAASGAFVFPIPHHKENLFPSFQKPSLHLSLAVYFRQAPTHKGGGGNGVDDIVFRDTDVWLKDKSVG